MGLPALVETPAFPRWHLVGNTLQTTVHVPAGRSYKLEEVHTWATRPEKAAAAVLPRFKAEPISGGVRITGALAPSLMTAQPVGAAAWRGAAGECAAPKTHALSSTLVVHGTTPDLMRATVGLKGVTRCESAPVTLTHGPVLISLLARNVSSGDSKVCLLEYPWRSCANGVASLASSAGWRRYQFTVSVGNHATATFLQLDTSKAGIHKVQYAGLSVHPLNLERTPVIVASPRGPAHLGGYLTQSPNSASSLWLGPSGSQRVVIDGLRNGWLSSRPNVPIRYWPRTLVICGYAATLGGILLMLGLAVAPRVRRRVP
jgi:hypothetical protein